MKHTTSQKAAFETVVASPFDTPTATDGNPASRSPTNTEAVTHCTSATATTIRSRVSIVRNEIARSASTSRRRRLVTPCSTSSSISSTSVVKRDASFLLASEILIAAPSRYGPPGGGPLPPSPIPSPVADVIGVPR